MTLFVFDWSVAVKWMLPKSGSAKALAFLDDVENKVQEFIAPDVFASEIAHVLTKAERKKIIPVGSAWRHVFDILRDGPRSSQYGFYLECIKRSLNNLHATQRSL